MDKDLYQDMQDSQWFKDKIRASDSYAQNVYASLCNMRWQPLEVFPILKNEYWSCSWRSAGGIVAELRGEGDYMDWYCSGIRDDYEGGYVAESDITDEIKQDLLALGWLVYNSKEDQ